MAKSAKSKKVGPKALVLTDEHVDRALRRQREVALRPEKSATVIVYSRPSGYWYAQAHDTKTGAQITDASGYSREEALRALRGKFSMIGVTIRSVADEDPYAVGSEHHATRKKMMRKYGKKTSEKVGRTMHEWKRGTLRSGSGGKVTSRKQAIAIGLSQARSKGYKVPPSPSGHSTMSLDARIRAHLGNMRPGQEIDARGIARALGGGFDPLEADYALARAEKAGFAVTSDGRWFGPAGGQTHHASRKKYPYIAYWVHSAWSRRARERTCLCPRHDDARRRGHHWLRPAGSSAPSRQGKLHVGRLARRRRGQTLMARKTAAQLDREIADALSSPKARKKRRDYELFYVSEDQQGGMNAEYVERYDNLTARRRHACTSAAGIDHVRQRR